MYSNVNIIFHKRNMFQVQHIIIINLKCYQIYLNIVYTHFAYCIDLLHTQTHFFVHRKKKSQIN